MTTNFLELASTLKYLEAKWLLEKKLILRPVTYLFKMKELNIIKHLEKQNWKLTLHFPEIKDKNIEINYRLYKRNPFRTIYKR